MRQRPTLQTERLILRPFELSDAADVQRLAGERAIADTTAVIPHPYEIHAAVEWIATHEQRFDANKNLDLAITLRSTDDLVGAIGLSIGKVSDRAEMGYWIAVPYWRQGYCTEAARALLRFAFTDLELNRVYAQYFARNPASGRIMEKLGMKREGFLRQHFKKWGRYEDIVLYGIL
jgi:ribosomal-protein-alanine N-acetyltransferase